MARCRPWSLLFSLNPPDQIDRGSNDSWGVPDVFHDPQVLKDFLPGSRKVREPSPRSELAGPAVPVPVPVPAAAGPGCPRGGGAAAGRARDLLQHCLWAAGITEQLLEAEARRDLQPSVPCRSAPHIAPPGPGQQPLPQPLVQPLGPFSGLQLGLGPAELGGQQGTATALPAPQVVLLQQVPQRIILQVKQPGPTTLALLPSPACCVLGSGQGLGPPAHKPTGHPYPAMPSPCGHQHPGAAAAQHSSIPTAKAVGIEWWHGESFWGLEPEWGNLDSFVSYF
ncbi:homeobox protein unc-4 homolog [Vidua chalybeata]|uniref:homeobox protein unc-4 homolog n=1 Tax=Vidua chalybeata TaxID=81927 RepID=UPI0023A83916|nr:homeobox protein unc-4 homolog [Vidua chalybeata]